MFDWVGQWVSAWEKIKSVECKRQETLRQAYVDLARNIRHLLSLDKTDIEAFSLKILEEVYYDLFLYGSDELIKKLNDLLDNRLNKKHGTYGELLFACQELLIHMRKEIFANTKLKPENVRFLTKKSPVG